MKVGAGVRFGSETRGGSFSRRQPAGEARISGDDIGDRPRTCPKKETLYDQSPRLAKQIPEPSTAFHWNSRVFDKVCDLRLFRGAFFLNNDLQATNNSHMRSTARLERAFHANLLLLYAVHNGTKRMSRVPCGTDGPAPRPAPAPRYCNQLPPTFPTPAIKFLSGNDQAPSLLTVDC